MADWYCPQCGKRYPLPGICPGFPGHEHRGNPAATVQVVDPAAANEASGAASAMGLRTTADMRAPAGNTDEGLSILSPSPASPPGEDDAASAGASAAPNDPNRAALEPALAVVAPIDGLMVQVRLRALRSTLETALQILTTIIDEPERGAC